MLCWQRNELKPLVARSHPPPDLSIQPPHESARFVGYAKRESEDENAARTEELKKKKKNKKSWKVEAKDLACAN